MSFTKNNESFVCYNCGSLVLPHPKSSRDHCTNCLYGLHVDINPGDRMNECRGNLAPIGLKIHSRKTQIVYKCQTCEKIVFCVAAPDDNQELLVNLGTKTWVDNSI
jgi:DNA-directed RNA polymerase subunit RPC12/RpoP